MKKNNIGYNCSCCNCEKNKKIVERIDNVLGIIVAVMEVGIGVLSAYVIHWYIQRIQYWLESAQAIH